MSLLNRARRLLSEDLMKSIIERVKSFLTQTYPMPYWEVIALGVFLVLAWID
jgi:hypothetical protein